VEVEPRVSKGSDDDSQSAATPSTRQ
jgi:hypothetical protein